MISLLVLCIAALPVGLRLFLGSVIPGIHEYEIFVFYGSDILVLLFIISALRRKKPILEMLLREYGGPLLFAFSLAAAASAFLAPSVSLGLYSLLRLGVLILFAYSVGSVAGPVKIMRAVLATIAVVAVAQSVVGILQFSQQSSLGLQVLGEPVLSLYSGGVSTISAEGGKMLRAYGTFPHPNILAGFLVLGLISLAYWYLWCEQELRREIFNHPRTWWNWRHALAALKLYIRHKYFYLRLLLASGTFITVIGLVLSLSRSGWIAAAVGLVVLCLAVARTRPGAAAAFRLMLMIAVCVAICYSLFKPIVSPRSQLLRTEASVSDRVAYGRMGLSILSGEIGGVGIGNQVLYGVRSHLYQRYGLNRVWNWEPIHNLYLLLGAELGWLGLLSFLAFLGMVACSQQSRVLWKEASLEWLVATAMLSALLTVGLFDHYLWTLQPGRLMLWLVIGLCLSRFTVATRKRAGV